MLKFHPKDTQIKDSKYGPEQVMKSGELGNFEPEYVARPGPGK